MKNNATTTTHLSFSLIKNTTYNPSSRSGDYEHDDDVMINKMPTLTRGMEGIDRFEPSQKSDYSFKGGKTW